MGLMWPPEIGKVARISIVIVRPTKIDIIRFGVMVLVSQVEMTMVLIMKTRIVVPRSSPNDARQT